MLFTINLYHPNQDGTLKEYTTTVEAVSPAKAVSIVEAIHVDDLVAVAGVEGYTRTVVTEYLCQGGGKEYTHSEYGYVANELLQNFKPSIIDTRI
jgi:hypothetical protein